MAKDNHNKNPACTGRQKGVSLIITLFIMIILLAVVLSISALLYSEVKIIRNIGNSVAGYYAAESGIEKVLFYDRQILPNDDIICESDSDCTSSPYVKCSNALCTIPSSRGLCSIFDSCIEDEYPDPNNPRDHSIYCNGDNGNPPADPVGTDCNRNTCTNCSVTFNTTFDGRTYRTTAKVYPNDTLSEFEIDSKGVYPIIGGAQRQIKIIVTEEPETSQ